MNHEVLSPSLFWAFMLARDPVRAALVLVLSALPVAFAKGAKGGGGTSSPSLGPSPPALPPALPGGGYWWIVTTTLLLPASDGPSTWDDPVVFYTDLVGIFTPVPEDSLTISNVTLLTMLSFHFSTDFVLVRFHLQLHSFLFCLFFVLPLFLSFLLGFLAVLFYFLTGRSKFCLVATVGEF